MPSTDPSSIADPKPFADLDTAAVARALSQIADRDDDLVDGFFERLEEVELPVEGRAPGVRLRREQGLAVRLVRGDQAWLSARDEITPTAFSEALRQVARAMPSAPYPEPALPVAPWEPPTELAELAELPLTVARAIRDRHVAFPLHLTVRRHRRWVQVVGPRLVPYPEREEFYSLAADLPWGRWGLLLPRLDGAREIIAEALVERFRCRQAASPEARRCVVVLGPQATAVLLHEAVAHALEADTLGLTSAPERAVGVPMGPAGLHILDDPGTAPHPVRRTTDDEGATVVRRWLLRDGVVEQPLADRRWARDSEVLLAGGGRRSDRHRAPGPRSTHLELIPGTHDRAGLLAEADGGLWATEASRGALDPWSGRFVLHLASARRIRGGAPADPVGPCRLVGSVADLLSRLTAVGSERVTAGAGWCAKGGQKLPVWATVPAIRLEDVEVLP